MNPYHKTVVILHKIRIPSVNHGDKLIPRSADYHALFMQTQGPDIHDRLLIAAGFYPFAPDFLRG